MKMRCEHCNKLVDPIMKRERNSDNMTCGKWLIFAWLLFMVGLGCLIYIYWKIDVYYCPDCKKKINK